MFPFSKSHPMFRLFPEPPSFLAVDDRLHLLVATSFTWLVLLCSYVL